MGHSEWSLMLFTLLGQMSAGIMLALLVAALIKPLDGHSPGIRILAGRLALATMVIALLFSFLHLGSPARAVYALSNMAASWLSREIFFATAFMVILALWVVAMELRYKKPELQLTLHVLAVIAGILMVYSMAMVYVIPTVPVWNSNATILAFFTTMLLLGIPSVLVVLMWKEYPLQLQVRMANVSRILLVLAFAGVFLRFITTWVVWPAAGIEPGAYDIPQVPFSFQLLQMGLLVAGTVLLAWWWHRVISLKERNISFAAWAWLFFFIAELKGRYFFYAVYYRLGV